MKFYVYELVDPRDGKTFYVGKGCGPRDRHTLKSGNSIKMRAIEEIRKAGLEPTVLRIASGLSEDDAYKIELQCIKAAANLTNIAPGRRGPYAGLIDRVSDYLDRMVPYSDDWPPGKKLLWILIRSQFLVDLLHMRSGRYGSA